MEGVLGKMPSSSSSRRRGTEEWEGASAPVNPGGQGLAGGPEQGKKREGGEANRSPASHCAGVERGGPATEASSGGWRC